LGVTGNTTDRGVLKYILCRKMGSNIGAIGVMVLCRSNDRGVSKYAFYASTVRISMRRRDGK